MAIALLALGIGGLRRRERDSCSANEAERESTGNKKADHSVFPFAVAVRVTSGNCRLGTHP